MRGLVFIAGSLSWCSTWVLYPLSRPPHPQSICLINLTNTYHVHAPLRDDGAYVTIRGASVPRVCGACLRGDIFTGASRTRAPPSLQCVSLAPIFQPTLAMRGEVRWHYMDLTKLGQFSRMAFQGSACAHELSHGHGPCGSLSDSPSCVCAA